MTLQRINSSSPLVDADSAGVHVNYLRPQEMAGSPFDVAAPAANVPAVVAYGAQQQTVHAIAGVAWSYSAAPTGGNLQILDDAGNAIFNIDVAASGPNQVFFDPPKVGSPGNRLIVTLAAGGGSVQGKVSVLGHRAMQLTIANSTLQLNFSLAADSCFIPLI